MTADAIEPSSEHTPLLPSTAPKTPVSESHENHDGPLLTPARKTSIFLILGAFILAIGIGDELISPAQTRVAEAIICRQYYSVHDPSIILPGHNSWWDNDSEHGVLLGIQERWCKLPQIQGDVATLMGWQTGLENIGSLVLAVPFGWFADQYGRRPLLVMLSFAFLLKAMWQQLILYNWTLFNVKLMWLSATYSIFGGGVTVAAAMVYTSATDITTPAERTARFFQMGAASMMTMFVAPPISAWLMQRNPWLAMFLGLLVLLVVVPFLGFLPETLHYRTRGDLHSAQGLPLRNEEPSESAWKRVVIYTREAVHHSVGFLAHDMRVGFLATVCMLHLLLVSGVRDVLLQFASTRYGISLSKSTLILSIRAGMNLFMMLVILPALSNWLNRRPAFQAHVSFADLLLARGSAIVMAIGFLLIALAGKLPMYIVGLVINTAGWGLLTYVRSLAVSFVDEHVVARLFAVTGLADTVGLMVGAPGLAKLFEIGVNKGGAWIGLPFLVCAAVIAIVSVGLGTMTPGELLKGQTDDEDEAPLAVSCNE